MRADAGRVDINLNDFRIRRVERAIRELGTQQDQRVGVHHGVEAAGETDQTGHPHIKGVVVLDVLFTAQGVDNRGLKLTGEFKQLLVRARAAAAAHQGDIAGVTQQLSQLFQLFFRRGYDGLRGVIPVSAGPFRRGLEGHIARDNDHRDAAVQHGLAHGDCQHLRDLLRG